MNKLYGPPLFIILLSMAGGCATLNESECRNADWRIIGLEDGSRGRTIAYIGKHRTACAKFDITPNLAAYSLGHEQGVVQYCTGPRGYELGQKNVAYNGVCPPDLEYEFLEGYRFGQQVYAVNREINALHSAIASNQKRMETIEDKISEKEMLLISDKSTEVQRKDLLLDIKELKNEFDVLDLEILDHQRQLMFEEEDMRRINHLNPYCPN